MENEKKEISDVFAYNIAKIELEPGVNFTEKYVIKTAVNYIKVNAGWLGTVDVYMPTRDIQQQYKNIFKNEYFYVDFLGEKHKVSVGLYDTIGKYFDDSKYAYLHFGYNFNDFDEAKNTVEDLKNQFIAKLNHLYTKDTEKILVQPSKKVINNYTVYGYVSLIETKDKNIAVKRYLLPAEKKEQYEDYLVIRPFDLSKNWLVDSVRDLSKVWKLTNGNVYVVVEIANEVEKNTDLDTLKKSYAKQMNEDFALIEEKYNVAKQKITKEYKVSDYFDIKVNGKTAYSIYTDKNLLYNTFDDNWYIEATMYIPETIMKKAHINEDTLFNMFGPSANALININKNTIMLNGRKVEQLHMYIYESKDSNEVENTYNKTTRKIVSFIESQLQQNKESER